MKRFLRGFLVAIFALLACAAIVLWFYTSNIPNRLWDNMPNAESLEIGQTDFDCTNSGGGRLRTFHLGSHHGGFYWEKFTVHFSPHMSHGDSHEHHFNVGVQPWFFDVPIAEMHHMTLEPDGPILGIKWGSFHDGISTGHILVVPAWMLVIPLMAWPSTVAARFIRMRRRVRAGKCATCGYDLRHSAERCPECGTPISETPAARKNARH